MSELFQIAQIVTGPLDAAWVLDALLLIVTGIIAFLYKDIRHELREIKTAQHNQAIDIARIKTKLELDDR